MLSENISNTAQVNALVLANVAEIGASVIARISGNEISNTLQGDTITKEKLVFLLLGQITSQLEKKVN